VVTDFGRAWNRATVHQVLTNEKYIGNNVYHRTSFKLKLKHVVNPQDKWIRADGVFEGIIEPEAFSTRRREIILARSRKLSDEEMLEKLRGVLKPARTHQRHSDRRSGRPAIQHGVQASFRQFGFRLPANRLRSRH
jgi:hypothetical protein